MDKKNQKNILQPQKNKNTLYGLENDSNIFQEKKSNLLNFKQSYSITTNRTYKKS